MNTYIHYQQTITKDCKHDIVQATYYSDIVHQLHVILHMKRCTVILLLRKGVKPVLGRQLSNNPRQIMESLHFLTNKYFFINRNSLASVFAKLCFVESIVLQSFLTNNNLIFVVVRLFLVFCFHSEPEMQHKQNSRHMCCHEKSIIVFEWNFFNKQN